MYVFVLHVWVYVFVDVCMCAGRNECVRVFGVCMCVRARVRAYLFAWIHVG